MTPIFMSRLLSTVQKKRDSFIESRIWTLKMFVKKLDGFIARISVFDGK